MTYVELTGQESGIWLHRSIFTHPKAIILNWSSSVSSDCIPLVFDDGIVWLPVMDDSDRYQWKKTGEGVELNSWLENTEIIYDANKDAEKESFKSLVGDVYTNDNYAILAPRDWN